MRGGTLDIIGVRNTPRIVVQPQRACASYEITRASLNRLLGVFVAVSE